MNFSAARSLWSGYERALARRPVLVQCTTSAGLWLAGDVLAQRIAEKRQSHEVDKQRAVATACFGLGFMGPVGHFWYLGLDHLASKLLSPGSKRFIAAKVLADTLVLGPLYVLAFYAFGSYCIDQTGWQGFSSKIKTDFIPTFIAELAIWPGFQTFNFKRIPVEHQLLAVNLMTLVDASFLSWARAQDDWSGMVLRNIKGAGDLKVGQQQVKEHKAS